MKKYDTIIWDWNGTLLNDVWLCVEIVNTILVNHNDLQLDATTYRDVFGFPITEYYRKIGIDFQKESFEVLTHKFIGSYESHVVKCELHNDVTNVLNGFADKGLHQFMLTAAHKEGVLPLLDHFSIRDFFKHVEGLDNHRAESKVERGIKLVENNEVRKEGTVLIGDTIHDYDVAREIGVDCILIANGHQSKKRLIKKTKNEIMILDELDQLFEFV